MTNYLWLLDAGHGGMKDGKYTTAPAKMHVFEDGLTFYEGVNNRAIVDNLKPMLKLNGVDFMLVHDAVLDTPLKERVARANRLYAKGRNCIYLSIHSDAMPDGAHGKGSGFSVYTSIGQTRSDKIGEIFATTLQLELAPFKLRTDRRDGDADKEENFYVLEKTKCPAILVENLFFDNRKEADFLLSELGQFSIAAALCMAILEVEEKIAV